jgi:hypothetical protein
VTRLEVRFSAEATEQLATLHRRRRGMLRRKIERVAASAPKGPYVQVKTPMDIAACEVLGDDGLVLVYAVVPRRELLRMLWGSEVDQQVRRRELARLMHGRWSD